MKDHKIDNLFKAGLSENKLTPPPAAWAKIEAELPSKNKKGAWFFLSIAASLILILSLGWVLTSKKASESSFNSNEQAKVEVEEASPKVDEPAPSTQPEKEEAQEIIQTIQSRVEQSQNLVARSEAPQTLINEESFSSEEAIEENILFTIEPLKLKTLAVSNTQLLKESDVMAIELNIQSSIQSYWANHQATSPDVVQKKKFSLTGGIVTVAKRVNNSKIGLSEFRKSKNDFFLNELKYGEKAEDIDDDEDSPLNQ